jgi:predicted nucleic acid-binding protein
MIAVDTNLLVYAHREDSQWHDAALIKITELAEAKSPWAIPWPCIHEFLAIVTHPRIYSPPTPLAAAINQIEAWFESPSLVLLAKTEGYWPELRSALEQGPHQWFSSPGCSRRRDLPRSWRPRVVDFRSRLQPFPGTHRGQSVRGLRVDGDDPAESTQKG